MSKKQSPLAATLLAHTTGRPHALSTWLTSAWRSCKAMGKPCAPAAVDGRAAVLGPEEENNSFSIKNTQHRVVVEHNYGSNLHIKFQIYFQRGTALPFGEIHFYSTLMPRGQNLDSTSPWGNAFLFITYVKEGNRIWTALLLGEMHFFSILMSRRAAEFGQHFP